jgi:rSAM/selenodomain-associated transferase 1
MSAETAPGNVILFGKEPQPGRVKTRLQPLLGADGATDLYRAFVSDTVARIGAEQGIQLTIAASPGPEPIHQSAPFLADLATAHGAALMPQPSGDLGPRMADTLKTVISQTGAPAVLIGTDLPTLPMAHLHEALAELAQHPWVFCPSSDGGYYLVGASPDALNNWHSDCVRLFTKIPWSTPAVLQTTLSRAGDLDIALGAAWYDVDEPDDVRHLAQHLPATLALPHIRAALKALGLNKAGATGATGATGTKC